MSDDSEEYTQEEIARRRDEVIRRMANTPPQHRTRTTPAPKKAKTTAEGRKPRKRGGAPAKP
jgi:hypothetical protein